MNTKMDILTNEELLKDKLTPCKEICPILLDIFLWKKDVYAYSLVGFVSFIFGLIWYYDLSVLTSISILGLTLTMADFFLPVLSKSVIAEDDWNAEKEKKFSIFVNRIAYYGVQIWNFQVHLQEWKRERPNWYSAVVVISLLTMAWIGHAVNNLILVYLIVVFLVLLPGLLHRRILHRYFANSIVAVADLLGIKRKTQ